MLSQSWNKPWLGQAEIAQYEAYIQRLEHASNNASELAVEKEKGPAE